MVLVVVLVCGTGGSWWGSAAREGSQGCKWAEREIEGPVWALVAGGGTALALFLVRGDRAVSKC